MPKFEEEFDIGEFTVAKVALQVVTGEGNIMKVIDPHNALIAGYQFKTGEGVVERIVHRIKKGRLVRPALYSLSKVTFYDRELSNVAHKGTKHFRTLCAIEEAAELHYRLMLSGGHD